MPEALINKSDTIPNINGRGGPWPHWFNVRLREVARAAKRHAVL